MKSVVRLLAVAVGCLLAFAAPATAQYMYLDVNGDGVNTAADILTSSSTGVDVWLKTNVNKDGSPAVCNTSGNQLDLSSYDFFLRSSGGAVTYDAWTNDPTVAFPTSVGDFASGTDAYHGRCCGAVLPAGTYKLGRQALSGIATGAKLDIVGSSSVNPAGFASFGTACEGNDFDNTYKLGSDWFDVDGTVSAGGGNSNPIIVAPLTASGSENSAFSVTASASDPDAGNTVTLSQTNNSGGFLPSPTSAGPVATPSLTLTNTPNFSQAGSYTVSWTATDNTTGTAAASTAITIDNTNRIPVITRPATASGTENVAFSVTASASDPDGQNTRLAQTNDAPFLPPATSAGPTLSPSLTLTGTPNFTQSGSYTVNWTATDNNSPAGSATPLSTAITIANANQNPVISAPATASGTENAAFSVTGSASDPDAGQLVTLSQTNGAPFLTASSSAGPLANPSITLSGTPNTTQSGSYTVNWTAVDNNSPAGTATPASTVITIADVAVNQNPVISAPATASGTENSAFSVTGSASDPDAGQLVTLSQTNGAPFLTASSSAGPLATPSITLSGTPNTTQSGTYTVNWTAVDNQTPAGSATPASTVITIADVVQNQNPVISAPPTASGTASSAFSVTGSASDPDAGQLVTLSQTNNAPFLTASSSAGPLATPSITLTGTPSATQNGTYTVNWTAVDNQSPAGSATPASTIITIASAADNAPVLALIGNKTIAEGADTDYPISATDVDGDLITMSATLPPFGALNAPITGTGSVTSSFNLAPGFSAAGSYTGTVTATANGVPDSETFDITVTNTDRPPSIDAIADVIVGQGGTASPNVNASDPDGDIVEVSASLPAFATLNPPLSGVGSVATTISINPTAGTTTGDYPASVTATAILLTDVEEFTITVTPTNQVVQIDAIADVTLDEGSTSFATVNASDADNQLITLSASLPGFATLMAPTTGTGSVTTTVSINPGFDDAGSYPSSVTATDGIQPVTEPFLITVNNVVVDQPPVLAAISNINVQEGASASTAVSATDTDGETITLNATLPAFATLDAPTSGAGSVSTTVTASPAPGDAGSYPSSVTATANGLTDTENFTINVGQPNQVPSISAPATETVNEGVNLNFAVTATDGDDDPLTLTAGGTPGAWTFQDNGNGNGTFDWTPGFSAAGPYTINFTVNDGRGGTNSATTEITVNNVNRCPTASTGGPYTGAVNFPVSFNGSASSDPDGDALTYAWTFGDGGSQTGANPTHTYTAGGVFTVTLVVDDGICTGTATTTATIVTEFPAAVFTVGGNNTTMLASGKPTTCVQIEPMGDSFDVSEVDLSTIVMISEGTGSVSEISAMGKTTIDGDKNSNGTTEIRACFSKEDLRLLFSLLPAGKNSVTVEIEGNLTTGGRFHGELTHTVKATGGPLAASVSPNPLNPETTLAFQVGTPGRVTVKIFDLNGRLVKTLLDDVRGAGYQQLNWDGTSNGGARVSSGVYFFRLDTPNGRQVLTATVLK